MAGVDYAILIVTLVTILFLGLAGKKKHDTVEDFFLGSRNLNWLKIGASLLPQISLLRPWLELPVLLI